MELKKNIRSLRYIDWISCALTMLLSGIGLLFVFSTTFTTQTAYSIFFKKQLFGLLTGFGFYLLFALIDYRIWFYLSLTNTAMLTSLLIFTLIKGTIGMGAQRWIDLIIFKFQPSEIAKLILPALVAAHAPHTPTAALTLPNTSTSWHNSITWFTSSWFTFITLLSITGVNFILILKQPDLGTAVLVLITSLSLLWLAGLSHRFFLIIGISMLLMSPAIWYQLKPYQKQRITVFFGYGSEHNERYQIEQSKIAIGSGGITGTGLLRGTQNRLLFLPESRTDFIFAIIGEEWGFIGTLSVLFLFFILCIRMFTLLSEVTDAQTKLLGVGLFLPIAFSILINIGMVVDLLPIVGIPLPLLSYGITHTWITFISLGTLQSIAIRQRSRS